MWFVWLPSIRKDDTKFILSLDTLFGGRYSICRFNNIIIEMTLLQGIVFLYVIISSSNFKANTAMPDTSIVVNSVTTNRDIREPSDQHPESEIFAARPHL